MKRTAILLVATACFLTGCAAFDVPDGYVKVKDPGRHAMKAVSADGAVLALRWHANEGADLDFWSKALEYQKADLDGLKLVARETIKTDAGEEGVMFDFEMGAGGGKVTYVVALFVTPQRIYTLESGGLAKTVAADREKINAAIRSLRF